MKKVSVLMCSYNTPIDYIKQSIDSILCQTFTDFELVIVNDGSTGKFKDILYDYAKLDSRIVIIENECNLGLQRSLNRGLEECKGEYVIRMDADDICYPNRFEKQVEFMDNNPSLIVSGAWVDVIRGDENETCDTWKPHMCSRDEYRIRLLFGNTSLISHPTAIFRRDYLEKHKLKYSTETRFRYAEDYKMWVDCSNVGDVGILESTVIKYRINHTGISATKKAEMRNCSRNIQAEELKKLNIQLTDETFKYHERLIYEIKPYDLRCKKWIKSLVKNNRKYKVYNQDLFEKMLYERWNRIIKDKIRRENSTLRKINYILKFFPEGRNNFIKTRLLERKGRIFKAN